MQSHQDPSPTHPLQERAVAEVFELHLFFEAWLAGRGSEETEHFGLLESRLEPGFQIVTPQGATLSRGSLIDNLAGAFGARGAAFRLWVRCARARPVAQDLYLVTYEEWQNAGDGDRGRVSSALLRLHAAGHNTWLHVHETELPGESASGESPETC